MQAIRISMTDERIKNMERVKIRTLPLFQIAEEQMRPTSCRNNIIHNSRENITKGLQYCLRRSLHK